MAIVKVECYGVYTPATVQPQPLTLAPVLPIWGLRLRPTDTPSPAEAQLEGHRELTYPPANCSLEERLISVACIVEAALINGSLSFREGVDPISVLFTTVMSLA